MLFLIIEVITILTIKTKSLENLAVLENAYAISYEKPFNEIPTASFSLPLNDPKNAECQPFNVVEIIDDSNGEYIGLFRIMPSLTKRNETLREVTYECHHVVTTLLDSVLFRYHQLTNYSTEYVLSYLLAQQQGGQHWRLGVVEFERYFHYGFQNENGLLGPLFSIPEPFDEPWTYTYETKSYPWTINLVKQSDTITGEIRYAKNMRGIERNIDPEDITNRIYPLGAGEGVNQLGIESVNNGVPYVEDTSSISQYGLRPYVWVDRKFKYADSLLEVANRHLKTVAIPKISYKVSVADLSPLPEFRHEIINEGDLIRIIDPDFGEVTARVMKKNKRDITGTPYDVVFEISNRINDITKNNVDLERKQEINDVYSQGSTNIDSHNYQDNADPNNPAVIRFFLPDDLLNINTLDLTYENEKFRAYSQATEGGGATVQSTSAGGGTTRSTTEGGSSTQTSSSGGGTSKSTESGGGTSQTSSAGGNHTHMMFSYNGNDTSEFTRRRYYTRSSGTSGLNIAVDLETSSTGDVYTAGSSGNHSHSVTIPSHSHNFTVPNHTHTVNIPSHSHSVTIPNHSHEITLPDHTHEIKHGIYRLNELPTSVEIRVDGNLTPYTSTSGQNIDLIPCLSKDSGGKIRRGQWHEVSIKPNKLSRVNANVISRLFIQSLIGGTH